MSFELIRMLCINSYKPRKVGELLLDHGHVLILGRNGAGKTALAQLIPLFYGVQPSQIVGKSGVKSTLAEFLLKTRSSYIAFEYRRHDGNESRRLAVLRTGEEGRIVYQFFRCGYDERLFITEDKMFRDFAELRTTATALGYTSSPVLNNADYTRVIQNLPSPTKRGDDLSRLSADYACVESGYNLRHIEKVVGSMYKESAGFDDLQHIVISSLRLRSEQTNTRELRLNKTDIYAWLNHRAAYLEIMKHAASMDEARAQAANLEELHRQIARIRAQTSRLQARAFSARTEASEEKSAAERMHTLSMGSLGERKANLDRALDEVKSALSQARSEQKGINERREYFGFNRAQQCSDEIDHVLPAKKTHLEEATKHKDILVGDQADVEHKYEAMKLARRARRMDVEASCNTQKDEVRNRAAGEKAARGGLETYELLAIDTARDNELKAREEKRDGLSSARADRETQVKRPLATPETVARIEAINDEIETTRAQLDAATKAERTKEAAKNTAHSSFLDLERAHNDSLNEEAKLRSDLADINDQITPRNDSLLAFLRNNVEAWEDTLGKVIDRDLLSRQDLNPSSSEADEGGAQLVMGVKLEIARIAQKTDLSVEHLKAARVRMEQAIEAAHGRVQSSANEMQAGGDRLKEASNALTLTRSAKERNEAQAQILSKQRDGLKRQRATEIENCIAEAQKALDAAQIALKSFDAETEKIRQRYAAQIAEVRAATSQANKTTDAELQAALIVFDEQIRNVRAEQEKDIQAIDKERVAALQSKGVDPARLAAVETEIAECNAEISRISGHQTLVTDWKTWKTSTALREPEIIRQITENERVKEARDRELAAIRLQIKQTEDQYNEFRAKFNSQIDHWTRVITGCDALPTATAMDIDGSLSEHLEEPNEATLITLQTLDAQAGPAVAEHRQAMQKLKNAVELVRSAMRNAEDVVIRDFFNTVATAVGPSENPVLWVKELSKWFDFGHRQVQQALSGTGKNIADTVRLFHNELLEFSNEIRRFNSALQSGLDRSMSAGASGMNQFDKLSGLKITVASRLQEEKMWGPMNAFVAELDALSGRDQSTELQGDDFAAALRKVLGIWGTDNSLRVDLANQIRIRGEITENGHRKLFASAQEFKDVSSSGLTCIILMIVLCGFVNMIRGNSKAIITWAIDETGRLDAANIRGMLDVLTANHIGLVTATPDLPKRSMQQFNHVVLVDDNQEILVATPPDAAALAAKYMEISSHV